MMSDDGDNIQVSDLDDEMNDDGNIVKEKNNLNAQKSKDQTTNGNISPYYTNINNNNAIETIAVIDIDGDGKYFSLLFLNYVSFIGETLFRILLYFVVYKRISILDKCLSKCHRGQNHLRLYCNDNRSDKNILVFLASIRRYLQSNNIRILIYYFKNQIVMRHILAFKLV